MYKHTCPHHSPVGHAQSWAPQVGKTHGSQPLAWGLCPFWATCVMSLDVISQTQDGLTLKPPTTQQMSRLALLPSPRVCSPNWSKKEFRGKKKSKPFSGIFFFPTFLRMKNNPSTHQHCQEGDFKCNPLESLQPRAGGWLQHVCSQQALPQKSQRERSSPCKARLLNPGSQKSGPSCSRQVFPKALIFSLRPDLSTRAFIVFGPQRSIGGMAWLLGNLFDLM